MVYTLSSKNGNTRLERLNPRGSGSLILYMHVLHVCVVITWAVFRRKARYTCISEDKDECPHLLGHRGLYHDSMEGLRRFEGGLDPPGY